MPPLDRDPQSPSPIQVPGSVLPGPANRTCSAP